MIQIESVLKQYSGRVLFRDLSWHIPGDGRIGLVGPNGAGKTTLLRILAGDEASDAGAIRRPRSVTVGYLPQEMMTPLGGSILAAVLDASAQVRAIEEEIEEIEHSMAHASGEGQSRLMSRYGDLRHRYEALGGYELEAQAKIILGGLGISSGQLHAPVSSLSGGFRMRVALARLLLCRPDLLLLDEPTNHLDLESLDWLEQFMSSYPGAVIVASHDRQFLNRMVEEIAEIDDGRFTLYPGNYDEYLEIRELRREQEEAAARQQAKRVEEIEKFIERFRAKATKARQVQSRVKMLSKMDRLEKRRRQRTVRFTFPPPARGGAVAIELRGLVKRYGEKTVYDGADFSAARGERIALVGPNGAGKTTLLRVLAGVLPFDGGTRTEGHNVSIAYYAQHQLESLDVGKTILEEVTPAAPDDVRPRVRSLLGLFLFSGDDVDKRIAVLSGGERARVALCKMLLRPANLLLLDEPTNHLDLRSREVLEEALEDYPGTIALISHDRYFINRIATKICEVRDGRLEMHLGNYDEYLDALKARPLRAVEENAATEAVTLPGAELRGRRKLEQEERRRRGRVLKPYLERLKKVEEEIAMGESRLREVTHSQTDPHVYSDEQRAREAAHERRGLEERLAWLYDEWTQLSEEMEQMSENVDR